MKLSTNLFIKTSFALLALTTSIKALQLDNAKSNQKRQVGSDKGLVLDTTQDRAAEASGFLGSGAVQAHSKYFQDFFTLQLAPHKLEFGHVCENPDDWEQRYERKDFKTHRDQGKVRWGDKHGGYGEHYWDYNHAGHGDSHDEGSETVADYQTYDEIPSASNRKIANANAREKRHHNQHQTAQQPQLVLDQATGQIVDQVTGKKFVLQPLN